MKVDKPGAFLFRGSLGESVITGWTFDVEGGPYPSKAEVLRTVLLHIAQEGGIELTPPDSPASFEAERIARQTIAAARGQRTGWLAWLRGRL